MKENTSVIRSAGVFLCPLILALTAILVDCAPSIAESSSDADLIAADEGGVQQGAKKGGDKGMEGGPCKDPIPCAVNRPPRPGGLDKASDGSACKTGVACKVPGAGCGPGASVSGRCTTIPLGGGNCACGCMF